MKKLLKKFAIWAFLGLLLVVVLMSLWGRGNSSPEQRKPFYTDLGKVELHKLPAEESGSRDVSPVAPASELPGTEGGTPGVAPKER
jgi:hypothetical protein